MPELPEVETVRRGLECLVVGKKIEAVSLFYPKMIISGTKEFQKALPGQEIQAIERRGKYLIFQLTDWSLISHLRMEGKYLYFSGEPLLDKHSHVRFDFTDKTSLIYQDVRKFGTMELLEKSAVQPYFAARKLGPEPNPADFQLEPFKAALKKSRKILKPHLLDQTLVAGLGNIYVDEVLWRAGLHPKRMAASLSDQEMALLHEQIIAVLQLGIEKGGSTIRTYRNALGEDGTMQNHLKVYGKAGQKCPRCGGELEKIKLAGRGTHLCPTCQVL
ncbi:DNA-formamidopyrimidine glycosylase [Streptococcus massiliensis]|uniref:Formamidopyrimidine-DNA glycosylase n=1 Tax=Streptococcus massiliensis TaxID=313439 RepID=A0A380KW81_9STRE|nr:DNA-formamidopyrimidine glycosylase [Streptococcus massiliensis]SUN76183.1 formamidopyrimidine-DNA glycosylase [Streptococcus massiliensis]